MRFPIPIIYLVSAHVTTKETLHPKERYTEFTNQECLRCIRRPFPIGDIVLLVDIDSELLKALKWSVAGIESYKMDQLC